MADAGVAEPNSSWPSNSPDSRAEQAAVGSGTGAVALPGVRSGSHFSPAFACGPLHCGDHGQVAPFPAPAATVHAVRPPHTAHRRRSPAASGFPRQSRKGRWWKPRKSTPPPPSSRCTIRVLAAFGSRPRPASKAVREHWPMIAAISPGVSTSAGLLLPLLRRRSSRPPDGRPWAWTTGWTKYWCSGFSRRPGQQWQSRKLS